MADELPGNLTESFWSAQDGGPSKRPINGFREHETGPSCADMR